MANALNLIMPLKEEVDVGQLMEVVSQNQGTMIRALEEIGTAHAARFVLFDLSQPNLVPTDTSTGPFALGLFTIYDGFFEAFVQEFTGHLAPVLDALVSATTDGEALAPVADHLPEFTEWVRRNDAAQQPPSNQLELYMAYPYTVQQIRAGGS